MWESVSTTGFRKKGMPNPATDKAYTVLGVWALLFLFVPVPAGADTTGDRIVITSEQIARMKTRKMADVLNRVSGLKAGDSSVSIHGSHKVKVFLDKRPVNDPTSSHGGVRWDMVPIENIKKIEILKGSGSLKYGDDASGGVILITTRKTRDISGNVRVYGGNHETGKAGGNCRFSTGRLGAFVSGSVYTTDGYKLNNDKKRKQAGAKIEFFPEEDTGIVLSADHMDEEKGMSGTADYPTPFSRKDSYMDSVSLSAHHENLRANTYFNEGEKHYTDVTRGVDSRLLVKKAGINADTDTPLGRWNDLNWGASAEWAQGTGTTLDRREETAISAFGSLSRRVSSLPVTITAGLRGNLYSDFDDSVNPELKLAWQKKSFRISAGYNRANNTPSFHQRYSQSSSKLTNPDLGMETSDNFTLSFTGQFTETVETGATLFYKRLEDRITYVRNSLGIGQYQNIGEASYKGIDIFWNWKVFDGLSFRAAYTYLDARDENTDLSLTAKARHKGNAEAIFSVFDDISIVTGFDASSEVYTRKDNSRTVPGYLVCNLRAEYTLGSFDLFSEVENLFDTEYYYVDGTIAPPLTWITGINWRF